MDGFPAAVDKAGNRKLQFPYKGVLLFQLKRVRFYQSIAEIRDILVLYALSVERVKANPRANLRIIITEHSADVPAAAVELLDQLACRAVVGAFRRHISAVLLP